MTTLIIADGLIQDVMSVSASHRGNRANLGRQEIARLYGVGRASGEGPLPRFISAAAESARDEPDAIKLVFICDRTQGSGLDAAETALSLMEPFKQLAAEATVLAVEPGRVPWKELLEVANNSAEPQSDMAANTQPRALIVGAHTELRIATIASALRNLFGYSKVAVCPHLVGSATREAHFAALRHILPSEGIDVILNLAEAAEFIDMDPAVFRGLDYAPCQIGPAGISQKLGSQPLAIVQRLCMHWTRAELRPLQGGFSGSLLFVAQGWQGESRTEPMVIKIDDTTQMRRELEGYYRIKDFVGKHVPSLGFPVIMGELVGVGMDLAAMEGTPETLQDNFEQAESDQSVAKFQLRLAKAIGNLSARLYRNTLRSEWIAPYREFVLHTADQTRWVEENASRILQYAKAEGLPAVAIDPDQLQIMLRLISANEDGFEMEVCLSHGDLNCKNIISDSADNLWFIDWTHTGDSPVELDFAKLENDVKFVMSKGFEAVDVPYLKQFEEYVLSHRMPSEADYLPASLGFVKDDLRFRKILSAIRIIRGACFELKDNDDWLVYQIALLKYALHTLSFDRQRNRGECETVQLLNALISVETLAFQLVAHDFHLRIRGDRPPSYPARQRISIDEAPWSVDTADYSPTYFVSPEVLAGEIQTDGSGWAHTEDLSLAEPAVMPGKSRTRDDQGRPLNPRGRTGLAGRGSLGRWGANPAVGIVVGRRTADDGNLEILVGNTETQLGLSLPRGFVLPNESPEQACERILAEKVGVGLPQSETHLLFEDFYYDRRQTDHSWVELRAYVVQVALDTMPDNFRPTNAFDEIDWRPLTAGTVNEISSSGARLVREAIGWFRDHDLIDTSHAAKLLSKTG